MKALVFPLGDEHYAFPLASVSQVLSSPRVTRLPVADQSVLGLVNVRGEIVPLFDLAGREDVGARRACAFAILVTTSQGPAALAVDVMPVSIEIDEALASTGDAGAPRVYPLDDRLVTLLEAEVLLATGRSGVPRAS